ncbi:hypothetical protein AB6A40_011231 [Gnathostoma spinigerum]|uniref:Uncharacterized protein n=1 Tax=Gnathostoma spinigerum TaxID=75299 RepID=A0ABD6EZF4_9BILA
MLLLSGVWRDDGPIAKFECYSLRSTQSSEPNRAVRNHEGLRFEVLKSVKETVLGFWAPLMSRVVYCSPNGVIQYCSPDRS